MKKFFNFLLSLSLIGSSFLLMKKNVSAIDQNFQSNEYLQLKEKVLKLEKVRLTNMENDEYAILKEMLEEYPNHIYKLKELSIDELRQRNCDDKQIKAIKNYDGTEEMTIKAAAYVDGSFYISNYYYDKAEDKTYATANASATWFGIPFFQLKDMLAIAVGTGDGNFVPIAFNPASSSATYKCDSGKTFTVPLNGNDTDQIDIDPQSFVKYIYQRESYSSEYKEVGQLTSVTAKFKGFISHKTNIISMRPCFVHQEMSLSSEGVSLSAGGLSLGFKVELGFSKEWCPNPQTYTL